MKSLTWQNICEVRGKESIGLNQQVGPGLEQGFQEAEGRQVCLLEQQLASMARPPALPQDSGCGVPVSEEDQGRVVQSDFASLTRTPPPPLPASACCWDLQHSRE